MQAEIFGFAKENEHFRYIFKGNHITKNLVIFCWGGPGSNTDFQLMLGTPKLGHHQIDGCFGAVCS